MDAFTQIETALTPEILAAATELQGVYGFADMPLKPSQLPGLTFTVRSSGSWPSAASTAPT